MDGIHVVVLHPVIFKKHLSVVSGVRVGRTAFVVWRYNAHMLHVSLCPCLCEMFVCISPASSSFPSGAPASLLPFSSQGCDCSQLTPLLLWQPENSLEKGQLATFSPGLPGSTLQRCVEWGRPLLAIWTTNGLHIWGSSSQSRLPLRLPVWLIKGRRGGNDHAISHSNQDASENGRGWY